MKKMVVRSIVLSVSILAMSLLFIGISSARIDSDSFVGMWLFNEGNGNTAADSSGNNHNGTIHGGANWVDGKFGDALSLDGTDDYVQVDHDDSLNVGGEHTIAFWIKLAQVPGGNMAVVTKDDWAPGFWWNATTIRHHTHNPGGTLHYIDAAWSPDTNWHHIAATYDGEEFAVFMDAKQIGSGVTGANLGRNALTDKPLVLGIYLATGQHAQWGAFLSAIVDDFVILNVALSEGDIETIMNQGLQTVADVEPSGKLTTTWADIKAD